VWLDAIAKTPGDLREELEKLVSDVLVEFARKPILRIGIVVVKATVGGTREFEVKKPSNGRCNDRTAKKVGLVPEKADAAWRPRLHGPWIEKVTAGSVGLKIQGPYRAFSGQFDDLLFKAADATMKGQPSSLSDSINRTKNVKETPSSVRRP
jgi:hypothetical protein